MTDPGPHVKCCASDFRTEPVRFSCGLFLDRCLIPCNTFIHHMLTKTFTHDAQGCVVSQRIMSP